ncbi:nuclear transport factor 2 family protein [Sphingomonas oryzagri]
MRRIGTRAILSVVLTASLVIASPAAFAGDRIVECHGHASVCQTLVEGEEQLASMLVSGDVKIVTRLFADNAIWTLSDGVRWTKTEAIAALRTAPRMKGSQLLRVSIYQQDNVAIVSWRESWQDPAKEGEQQSFGTDTWMRRNARWQIMASQEARRSPTP